MEEKDVFDAYRQKIQSENDLINQRMTWFIVLQSFLFISSAIASNAAALDKAIGFILAGAASIGLTSAALAFMSVGSALNAIRATKFRWDTKFINTAKADSPYLIFPALTGGAVGDNLSKSGRQLPRLLPVVVGIFWFLSLAYLALKFSVSLIGLCETPTS